jgi:hypothetical protein
VPPVSAFDWMAEWWDDEAAMVWNPPGSFDLLFPPRSVHLVPPTIWYGLGLLARNDIAGAVAAFEAVIACQLDEPGAPWHGTFARFREFPPPRAGAVEFVGYDPNWRQFVGTGLALALLIGRNDLPGAAVDAMIGAIEMAVDGEPPDRVAPSYSNIALMRAWMEVHCGELLDRPDLHKRGEELAAAIVERFDAHGAFDEWNSPTYYGIDLYALRLWRLRSSLLRTAGERMEAALWSDLAPWYHAGLRNIAGPYTRAYGMDMCRYVAAVGLWMQQAAPEAAAPLPDLSGPFSHSHDLSLAPVVELLEASVPDDATSHLHRFSGERSVHRIVSDDPERVATGWFGERVMIGAERGGRTWSARGQYHPVTVHWWDPAGRTRWMRMVHAGPIEATALEAGLVAVCHPHRRRGAQPTSFLLSAAESVTADRWELPGLTVRVECDGQFAGSGPSGDLTEARYDPPASGVTKFELSVSA